ncbi:TSPO(outer membrane tryptophan-rich sensory protein)-related [Hibiscus trionum]|uniref:TSPO(Outer membrane tryptophan-rich sensory protein)-related n=1 Tax=Hibiscus trionum TaxID=183268 RepID=A0A9W7LZ02_HIBTR|nr:TSPO(outer membrane tryptophan-rich sensory protein)-related [Hibiscus trionum]
MSSETLQIQHDYQPSRVKPEDKEFRTMKALCSLTVAIAVPLSLTLFIIFEFGSAKRHRFVMGEPAWFPPLLLINIASIWSSFSMSLAAWIVWVDHGFHMNSDALPLYISQVSLSIVWHPLQLVIGSVRFGFVVCLLHFGTLFACYHSFRKFNKFAADLVIPCLFCSAFLTIISCKLIIH